MTLAISILVFKESGGLNPGESVAQGHWIASSWILNGLPVAAARRLVLY